MTAEFRVVRVDPEGSGMDYSGHEGRTVTDARRCCVNCACIFGTIGKNTSFGPFVPGELEALNDEAHALLSDIATQSNGTPDEVLEKC